MRSDAWWLSTRRTRRSRRSQTDDETWPAAPEAEAFRLGLYALVRLGTYEPLAGAVLDSSGLPIVNWWPVAYALGRIEDSRAVPALLQILNAPGKYSAGFAARGLGVLKEAAAVSPLVNLATTPGTPREVVVSAVRALAAIGDARASAPLVKLASDANDPNIRLQAVTALGTLKAADGLPVVQDLLTDSWPTMRATALRAAAAIDLENFVLVLSGMEPDSQWTVRAALAEVLGTLPNNVALERLRAMLHDDDRRVVPSVLNALTHLKASDAGAVALAELKEPDFVVRATAARIIGELKPAGGVEALREALALAAADTAIDARAAILYGAVGIRRSDRHGRFERRRSTTRTGPFACTRRRSSPRSIRPPTLWPRCGRCPGSPGRPTTMPDLIGPAFSPHVFIETAKGIIEFELAVLDAPQTAWSFMTLARSGFFNGLQIHRVVPNFVVQDGDPRGDGDGGPGFTIRDELNERPFLRGTVGMALSWKDTGGSQFFITHSPQPHLDARVHGVRSRGQRHGRSRSNPAGRYDSAGARLGREDDAVKARNSQFAIRGSHVRLRLAWQP